MFRIITGVVVTIFGISLMYMWLPEGVFGGLPGMLIAGIGIAIIMNKKEDKIEEVKNKENKSKNHE